MKLSIIIPIYNVEAYLERCIESIIQQKEFNITNDNLEIILINDGSPDNSQVIIDKYVDNYTYIKGYTKNNGGLSDARNYGLSKSTGDYIWFIDSDDWIDNNSLQVIFSEIMEENLDMFEFSWKEAFEENNTFRYVNDSYYESLGDGKVISGVEYLSKYGYVVSSWNKVVRKELYEGLLFPLGTFSEDNIITLFLMRRSLRFKKKPYRLYNYFFRVGSITTSKSEVHLRKYYKDRLEISLKIQEIIEKDILGLDDYQKIVEANRFFVINLLYDVVKSLPLVELTKLITVLEENKLYPISPYSYHNKGVKRELFRLLINQKWLITTLDKLGLGGKG
ncbi:glycosyltransferase family 2 protein [Myroides odoratimimus]|uniref:glycosyltransferase family 2 protein n=1 Tax=Myroides odoratimimus TaxID=76832 RepID=UPI0021808A65|nr:glycosyltransferase [Myroides odoratimimus]MCS7472745.1 glycosyltransferase [Myroides odoratimimus]